MNRFAIYSRVNFDWLAFIKFFLWELAKLTTILEYEVRFNVSQFRMKNCLGNSWNFKILIDAALAFPWIACLQAFKKTAISNRILLDKRSFKMLFDVFQFVVSFSSQSWKISYHSSDFKRNGFETSAANEWHFDLLFNCTQSEEMLHRDKEISLHT